MRMIKNVVRKGGLEPPWIAPPDPKSGASANFATFALCTAYSFCTVCLDSDCMDRFVVGLGHHQPTGKGRVIAMPPAVSFKSARVRWSKGRRENDGRRCRLVRPGSGA